MTPTLTTYDAAVQYVSDLAHAKLPQEWHSRLEMATALCLHGMIDFDAHGVCHVQSSDTERWYLVNGRCQCEAATYHPDEDYWCKHRIARGLALKARALLTQQAEEQTARTEAGRNAPNEASSNANVETSPSGATSDTPDATLAVPEGKNGGSPPTHTE